jgi:hypothetical protein
MAKSTTEEKDTGKMPVPLEEPIGTRLVTVLYSRQRDLYRVPSLHKPCWLSVKAYDLPATALAADAIYLGPSPGADGLRWRKAYSTSWRAIVPGDVATLPADDPMVRDYEAFSK